MGSSITERKFKTKLKYFAAAALIAIVGWSVIWLQKPAPGTILTVMTYNMGNLALPSPAKEQIIRIVRQNGVPDVLFVQELPGTITIEHLAKELGFPYCAMGNRKRSLRRVAVLSKTPLSAEDTIDFDTYQSGDHLTLPGAVCARTEIDNRKILLCSVHMTTLRYKFDRMNQDGDSLENLAKIVYSEMFKDTLHSRSVRKLLRWLEAKDCDTAIIGGDFNTFPVSKAIRKMTDEYEDALWPSTDYFRGTKLKVNETLTSSKDPGGLRLRIHPRIDYVFHTEDIDCLGAEIVRKTAGDHYPVRATLAIAK